MNVTTKTTVTTLVLLIAGASVLALGGKTGDGNATGQITQLTVWNPNATVTGITEDGPLWLGYTVRWDDGTEIDYDPIKVKGKFSKQISFAARPQTLDEVIVCLWRYKVSKSRCAEDNGGTACQYCKKNGYHMDGNMDRTTGS